MLRATEGELLSSHTTLGLGGPAQLFVEPESELELEEALRLAKDRGMPAFVLGGGSNVLVADRGFEGLVLSTLRLDGFRFEPTRIGEMLIARAGASLDACVAASIDRGLSGIESLSGIPGTIGATPIQNVGAYGQEVSETIVSVRAHDRRSLRFIELSKADCQFSYRQSMLKKDPDGFVVVEVRFALRRDPPTVRYPELARALDGRAVTVEAVREAVLSIRRSKSMVIEASDENHRSVGSFFLNPIVDESVGDEVVAQSLRSGLATEESEVPRYPASPGRVKLSAAWLIERAGFVKGFRDGSVGVSSRHSLALVHHGGGTTRELLELAERIRRGVREKFGVELMREPIGLGV
ncbi:MAG: UDP-N-acetylmuramate dehydrogenase [Deltaproteobacteria bacterium]|nr:UDP-N-acetylmuramate dehydrogenase [Deltaproteobacteria bacterium]